MVRQFIRHILGITMPIILLATGCNATYSDDGAKNSDVDTQKSTSKTENELEASPTSTTKRFNQYMQYMAGTDTTGYWPPASPEPLAGAILPYNRVVAYYGNLYSKRMGALGQYPKDIMISKLLDDCKKWSDADSMLPVIPALHYIAVTAQPAPGSDGKHRLRMPFHQIDTILNWSKEINALSFLDIQVGHSTVQEEVPNLEKYLMLPTVHLGLDPEFSMKSGASPGDEIGSFDAADINFTINYLAELVRKHNLPPKMLVVHRFTKDMLTNYDKIKLVPEVQIIIDMDGWGPKQLKLSSWNRFIVPEPVQFAGFKIFYHNDTKKGKNQLYQPAELAQFSPRPLYIQYQ